MLRLDVNGLRRGELDLLELLSEPPKPPPDSPQEIRDDEADDETESVVVESFIVDAADCALGSVLDAVDVEREVRQFLRFHDGVCRDCLSVDAIKVTAAAHRVVKKWLESVPATLPKFAPWREECRALGFDLTEWIEWEQSVEFYRAEERRLRKLLHAAKSPTTATEG